MGMCVNHMKIQKGKERFVGYLKFELNVKGLSRSLVAISNYL